MKTLTESNCQFSQHKMSREIYLVWWQLSSWSTALLGVLVKVIHCSQFLWSECDSENQKWGGDTYMERLVWHRQPDLRSLIWSDLSLMNWSLFWGRWCNVPTYQCLSPVWGSLWGRRASIEPLSDPTTALGSPSDTHDTHDGSRNLFSIYDVAVLVVVYYTFGCFCFFVANMLNVAPSLLHKIAKLTRSSYVIFFCLLSLFWISQVAFVGLSNHFGRAKYFSNHSDA